MVDYLRKNFIELLRGASRSWARNMAVKFEKLTAPSYEIVGTSSSGESLDELEFIIKFKLKRAAKKDLVEGDFIEVSK